ncbi:hypothetical protein LTR66_012300 [Elasticomyces elasticus]|nr:hypothetical protein LTR66_012300 [Elasticomyces elasticus]KAK4978302.1 hypothetical protein LTR28_006395 [Elasticomyces elasticus]
MGPSNADRIEAPVTVKAYMMCGFAAFAGILFGYDSGYISGVLGMAFFKKEFGHPVPTSIDETGFLYSTSNKSLIVSILSAGTFFGALFAGALADWIGRRMTIIIGCIVFSVGVILQVASTSVGLLVPGRLIAGVGVGFVSAINILYMSEVAPRKVRGAIVSGYQFAITIGIMLASIVTNATQHRNNASSYRIAMAIQFVWAFILAVGLFLLPESPRYFVKKGQVDAATDALARVRGQPRDSAYIQDELAEILANYQYEMEIGEVGWIGLLSGGWSPAGNFRKVVLGALLQMMQQWTGVNFIFYYSTTYFQQIGLKNAFLISMITTIVNVCSTPISFYTIEKFGRRTLLIYGAIGMLVCEFIVAIVGTADPKGHSAQGALIAFVCIYIFFFASTWGPGAWVVIGEIFPLPIRSKGVAVSTASNWFWNCIIGIITPYMVDKDQGNLGSKVFFIWGALCTACVIFAYFMVPETKGLTLEQVDKMLEETTPRTSAKWRPHETYATAMEKHSEAATVEHVEPKSAGV